MQTNGTVKGNGLPVTPREKAAFDSYRNQLQHRSTTQSLLEQKKNILQQQQAAGADPMQIQSTQTDIAKLEKMLAAQQQKLQQTEQNPALQTIADKTRAGYDLEYTEVEHIGKSVGAKAKNYNVYDPRTGDFIKLAEGTTITQPKNHTLAGKGRIRQIDCVDWLVDKYGGEDLQWTKEMGFGYIVDEYGEMHRVELHWYQESTVGKVEMKIKYREGSAYLDED